MDLTLTGGDKLSRGCAYAREKAITKLDDELLRCKPSGWTVLGFRERTMVTRFGAWWSVVVCTETPISGTVFALDSVWDGGLGNWRVRRSAEMATEMAFRKVSDTVSALTAGELVEDGWLLQSVGEEALAEERERWESSSSVERM